MEHYNVHDAKTQLSQLIAKAEAGEPIIIARAGKPVVRMIAIESPPVSKRSRLGFLRGHIKVPEDFDRMGQEEIREHFES